MRTMSCRSVLLVLLFSLPAPRLEARQTPALPSLREQAALQQSWLRERLDRYLPALMRTYGVRMWIIPMREYNEDPVFSSLVSATTFAARRRTIFVFVDTGGTSGVRRLSLGGSTQGGIYEAVRDTAAGNGELWGDPQWNLLRKIVQKEDPATIGVNISAVHAFSDGLSAGEWESLQRALGPVYTARVVRADRLALDFIALRVPEMLPTYRAMMEVSHAIIARGFSADVIVPGTTTTEDVVWWMREAAQRAGFGTWFQPSVDIQRRGADLSGTTSPVIERGDVLHCDFGVTALRLNTDTQHLGYVLREGETSVPSGLLLALQNGQRAQDIVVAEISRGGTGNDILKRARAALVAAGVNGTVYSHPIGEHGHGAGTLIGLWDHQEGVPGRGDVEVIPNTWFSVELQASTAIPEWAGQVVRIPMEEDISLDSTGRAGWVLPRQTAFHLVR